MSNDRNLFSDLVASAERSPDKAAVVTVAGKTAEGRTDYAELSYRELTERVERCSAALAAHGIRQDMRVLFFVLPSLDCVVLLHALLRLGAVPVFIDPGHPVERLIALIREADPQALIAIPLAFMLKASSPPAFANVSVSIVVGDPIPGATSFDELMRQSHPRCPAASVALDDAAMIVFTSGSTGLPKGVEFTLRMLRSVIARERCDRYGLRDDGIDLTMFPIMLAILPATGMTMVLPLLDLTRPGGFDPSAFVELISSRGCTTCVGSTPVFWTKVADYCLEHGLVLPSLQSVLLSGAPAPVNLLRRLRDVLPNAACHVPLGSTECGSVASIEAREILAETGARTEQGAGICVGRPFDDHAVRVIALTEGAIVDWQAARPLPTHEIGEIVVQGPGASPRYFRRPDANALAKIPAENGAFWHRTGDVGYLDEQGRLWFCGRVSQIIELDGERHYPVMVEGAFNAEPSVLRSGLVHVVGEGLVLCLELRPDAAANDREALLDAIRARAQGLRLRLRHVLIHPSGFPVDARHNAKIDYAALTAWATDQFKSATEAAQ